MTTKVTEAINVNQSPRRLTTCPSHKNEIFYYIEKFTHYTSYQSYLTISVTAQAQSDKGTEAQRFFVLNEKESIKI